MKPQPCMSAQDSSRTGVNPRQLRGPAARGSTPPGTVTLQSSQNRVHLPKKGGTSSAS